VKQTGSAATRILVALVIVAAAGAGGYFGFRQVANQSGESAALTPEASPADIAAAAAQPKPDAPSRTIPDTLPDITLADRDGTPTRLASFAGRPLMVNFWATWCAPCRREIPLLNKIRKERQATNGEIVGIAVDFKEEVLKFTQQVSIDYPLLIGEDDGLAAAEAFGMGMAFPFSIFIDSQNRILTVKIGELHEDEANFAFDRLQDIDRGALTREAAQAQVAAAFKQMAAARATSGSAEAH
jgi:thiol-disulfide isomerase/thioredoxin